MNEIAEALDAARLYTEGQGDKFHPLSDEINGLFEVKADDNQVELLAELRAMLDRYGANPESKYHIYHVDRLRSMLDA